MTDALTQIQSDLAALAAAGSPFGQPVTLTRQDGSSETIRIVPQPSETRRNEHETGAADIATLRALLTSYAAAPRIRDTVTGADGRVWQIVDLRNAYAGQCIAELVADTQVHRHDSGYRKMAR